MRTSLKEECTAFTSLVNELSHCTLHSGPQDGARKKERGRQLLLSTSFDSPGCRCHCVSSLEINIGRHQGAEIAGPGCTSTRPVLTNGGGGLNGPKTHTPTIFPNPDKNTKFWPFGPILGTQRPILRQLQVHKDHFFPKLGFK